MGVIPLTALDLSLAALLVLLVAFFSWRLHLGFTQSILVAGARTAVQLLLIGMVLRILFANASLGWIALMGTIMLLAAVPEFLLIKNMASLEVNLGPVLLAQGLAVTSFLYKILWWGNLVYVWQVALLGMGVADLCHWSRRKVIASALVLYGVVAFFMATVGTILDML